MKRECPNCKGGEIYWMGFYRDDILRCIDCGEKGNEDHFDPNLDGGEKKCIKD